jgi:hypothetical protein
MRFVAGRLQHIFQHLTANEIMLNNRDPRLIHDFPYKIHPLPTIVGKRAAPH